MAIDASIIAGLRQAQAVQLPDPMEQYSKSLALKNLMAQGDMQGLQMKQARQGIEDDQAQRSALTESAGDNKRYRALLAERGQYKPVQALDKFNLENEKTQTGIAKDRQEIVTKAAADHRDQLANINDPQTAAQWVTAGFHDPVLGPVLSKYIPLDQALAKIPQDPQAFLQWKQQAALGATKFIEANKPHVTTQDLGGTSQIVSTPGLGGTPSVLSSAPKTETPGQIESNRIARAGQKETERHHAAIEGDPDTIESTAKAIAEGRLAPLSGFALGRPMGQAIMSRVTQLNPEFDPTQFQVRQKSEKDFATGKQGNSVRSFNVALSHLDTLDQLAEALHNGNMQSVNKIGNLVADQTGKPAPANFEAAKKIVSDEIVKAIVGSGGGVTDREAAAKTVDAANSPAKLKGVIATYKELMRGQIGGLRDQYKATTGKDDFDTKYLSEAGRQTAHGADSAKGDPKVFDSMPDPAKYKGKRMKADDGTVYVSDGNKWKRS